MPKKTGALVNKLPKILEDAENELTDFSRELFHNLYQELKRMIQKVKDYDKRVATLCSNNPTCKRLTALPGVGPLIATAVVSTVENGKHFKNGREIAAYIGLVARQYSTGGKQKLPGISKRGDRYLRALFIHGARAAIHSSKQMSERR